MKNFKRLSCLAAAVLLCLILALPAYAVDSGAEESYEAALISGADDEVALLSLDDENMDRSLVVSGSFYYGLNTDEDYMNVARKTYSYSWAGQGRYMLSYSNFTNSLDVVGWSSAGGTVDWSAVTAYPASAEDYIDVSGYVQFFLYPSSAYAINDGSEVDSNALAHGIFPSRMALLVNGVLFGDVVTSSGQGTFSLDFDVPLDETVTSLGYRFYFDTAQSVSYTETTASSSRSMLMAIHDSGVVARVVPVPEYAPWFENVINEVKAVPSTIYNFFFGDSGDDVASSFNDAAQSAVTSAENVQQEIEDGLDKPEPDQIVPDITDIVPQEDYTTFTDVFAPVMQSQLVINMMLIVCSFAFVSYVLFGKKV